MLSPKISIIIPMYNVEKYIKRCLLSVFHNSIINDCEVILIDDCSTDNTIQVAEDLVAQHRFIQVKLICNSFNKGSAESRNIGLQNSIGKYIICVDSDDWVESNYLELLYNEAEATNADVTCCDFFRECKAGNFVVRANPGSTARDVVSNIANNKYFGYLWIKLLKRSFIEKNHLFFIEKIDLWEDVLFSLKIFSEDPIFSYINVPLYHYFDNPLSIVHGLTSEKCLNLRLAVEEIERFWKKTGLFNEYLKDLITLIIRIDILIVLKSNIDSYKNLKKLTKEQYWFSKISLSKKILYFVLIKMYNPVGRFVSFGFKKIKKIKD